MTIPVVAASSVGRNERQPVIDTLRRPLHDLRISLTDRCNFRCVYCMPRKIFGAGYHFLPQASLLTFEEIELLSRVFVSLGVEKIRLTGGEPLLRPELPQLVERLASIEGLKDLTLTTNGALLTAKIAQDLRAAGLRRITISLDALDDAVFQRMNDVGVPASRILEAIDCAAVAGLAPIKIDMVVRRGYNEQAITPMAEYFRGTGHILRFIEFMDVGNTNGWRREEVIPAAEILAVLRERWGIVPLEPAYYGEVAERWAYADGAGEFGIIASVTQPFCRTCTRARLSAEGKLYTCLFAHNGFDLCTPLRAGLGIEEMRELIRQRWSVRTDRYSELRVERPVHWKKVEMSHIGG
ncbi:MAG: GTP 3',8-cyclase MoaA [Chloroflexi bacterium]|nr:GTP 3',8-cyclase MoaA [Chloroflexota bacterium]